MSKNKDDKQRFNSLLKNNSKESKSRRKSQFTNYESSRRTKDSSSNLITNYYKTREGVDQKDNKKNNDDMESINVIQKLENELSQKEAEREALKQRQIKITDETNNVIYENDMFRKRYKEIAIQSLTKLYSEKRKERMNHKKNIGIMVENKYKHDFVEGPDFIKVREKQSQNMKALVSTQELLKNSATNQSMKPALKFKHELLMKEKREIEEELSKLNRQKQQLSKLWNLSKLEQNCRFAKKQWGVLQNRYVPLELLGKGGFSEVYKCFDLEEADYFALKLSQPPESSSTNQKESFFKHMLREYETQSKLNHPNIARVFNRIDISDSSYILATTVELCEGPQLSDYLKRIYYVEEQQAKMIIKQIINALEYMNKYNVIHYDLKPRNIMFHQGIVKVLDFGLCKVNNTNETKMELTTPGAGTYYYLPPQAFEQQPKISGKLDMWSLGVIFYQMLFGKRPFGNGMKQQKIRRQKIILNSQLVQFPETHSNPVSIQAKQFIVRCLTRDQNERISAEQANNCPYMQFN